MKILIADDHTLFRDTLLEYFKRWQPEVQTLVANDLQSAFEYLESGEKPDLILLDYQMPGMEGLRGLRKIAAQYPDMPVSLMSGVAEQKEVEEAIELGIVGYFPKTMSGKALMKAIHLVLAGEKFYPSQAGVQGLMPSYYGTPHGGGSKQPDNTPVAQSPELTKRLERISRREREVLGYLVQGLSNKEIANILNLQLVTIKLHVRGVCRKLGAKNRTQAALIAKDCGFESAGIQS